MEKSYSSTRKKLTAAIAMLLIAALMVVTATYAWFTLSTSPEVTGITTTVGANGNLEIALGSSDNWGDPSLITSDVGDSNLAIVQKNLTWGNIVDLSAADYHLNDIILNPACLNIAGGKIGAVPLLTPTYGNDGRVAGLMPNTVSGIFAGGSFKDGGYGVRVLGTASDMTDQQLAYRNAKSLIANAASDANSKAAASLNESGSKLADIIVKHATSAGDADTNTYNIEFIGSMITKLTDANAQYETVVKQYFIAEAASRLPEKAAYDTAVSAINATAITDLIATGVNGTTLPAGPVKSIADIYTANAAAIAEATTKLGTVADKTAASWTDTKAVLDPLVNTANVTVNGIAASDVKTRIDDLASAVMNEGLKVEMPSGSGVYSNFADVGGNYSSSITISELIYGSVKLTNINATMTTKCTNNYAANIAYPAAPANAAGAGTKISDSYGYALDFWFRTNASGSDLLLQEEGQQRVYHDSENTATRGGGSYMEFESTNANFTTENVEKLMQAIRIVFADKEGTPLAYAKLSTTTEITGSKVKAPIELWAAEVAADGKITYTGDAKLDSQKITALTANTPTAISVYVYLDGDVVDNGAVANAATSMKGSMNLQFASTATLTPMKNTPLFDGQ